LLAALTLDNPDTPDVEDFTLPASLLSSFIPSLLSSGITLSSSVLSITIFTYNINITLTLSLLALTDSTYVSSAEHVQMAKKWSWQAQFTILYVQYLCVISTLV
jgi:hypothetical protein